MQGRKDMDSGKVREGRRRDMMEGKERRGRYLERNGWMKGRKGII